MKNMVNIHPTKLTDNVIDLIGKEWMLVRGV